MGMYRHPVKQNMNDSLVNVKYKQKRAKRILENDYSLEKIKKKKNEKIGDSYFLDFSN